MPCTSMGPLWTVQIILPKIVAKSHSFGHSYSTRNILPRIVAKSHSFGHSYSTRNILPRIVAKEKKAMSSAPPILVVLIPLVPFESTVVQQINSLLGK